MPLRKRELLDNVIAGAGETCSVSYFSYFVDSVHYFMTGDGDTCKICIYLVLLLLITASSSEARPVTDYNLPVKEF